MKNIKIEITTITLNKKPISIKRPFNVRPMKMRKSTEIKSLKELCHQPNPLSESFLDSISTDQTMENMDIEIESVEMDSKIRNVDEQKNNQEIIILQKG